MEKSPEKRRLGKKIVTGVLAAAAGVLPVSETGLNKKAEAQTMEPPRKEIKVEKPTPKEAKTAFVFTGQKQEAEPEELVSSQEMKTEIAPETEGVLVGLEGEETVKKNEPEIKEKAQELKEFLSFDKFKEKILEVITKKVKGGEVNKFEINKADGKIVFDILMTVKGFDVGLKGNIINKDGGIGLDSTEAKVPWIFKGLVSKYLDNLPQIFVDSLKEDFQKEIKNLRIDDAGNLDIHFKSNNS